jgi:hypothetical protein
VKTSIESSADHPNASVSERKHFDRGWKPDGIGTKWECSDAPSLVQFAESAGFDEPNVTGEAYLRSQT